MGCTAFYVYQIMREVGSDVWSPIYVGKGKNGRAYDHEKVAKRIAALPPEDRGAAVRRCRNRKLMRTLIKCGGTLPVEFVATGLTEAEAFALEVETIGRFGRARSGCYGLHNLTDGGEGVSGLVWGDESRAKQSEAGKAQWDDPVYCEKMSAAQKDQMSSPEVRAKLSAARKAQWDDPVYRAKMSAAAKAQWDDPVYRAKNSGDTNPAKRPEVRAKISEAQRGDRNPSKRPEVRAKMSAAAKAAWARRRAALTTLRELGGREAAQDGRHQ
jgi:hypothetical protein